MIFDFTKLTRETDSFRYFFTSSGYQPDPKPEICLTSKLSETRSPRKLQSAQYPVPHSRFPTQPYSSCPSIIGTSMGYFISHRDLKIMHILKEHSPIITLFVYQDGIPLGVPVLALTDFIFIAILRCKKNFFSFTLKEDGMKTSRNRQTVLIFILIFISGAIANADTYIKQTRRTDPFEVMGQTQPEKIETTVTWLGKNRARIDAGEETSMIIFPDKKLMYMLNHKEQTYMEMPLNAQEAVNAMIKDEGDEESRKAAEMARDMAQSMMQGIEVKVTETNETRKVKNWNARKYYIEMTMPMAGNSRSEAWATEEIKIDPRVYWTAANAMMAAQPGFDKVIQEMQKIKGFIVFQETRGEAMGAEVKTTEELVEMTEKDAPAGTFDIPRGYTKTEGFRPQ